MSRERLDSYLAALGELPLGLDRTKVLELAITEADALGDAELGFDLRMELIESCFFHGYGDRAIAGFAWCLKYSDRNPQPYQLHTILWRYKWVLHALTRLPQISKAKILEMIDDMGRRATEAGYGPRPIHYLRWKVLSEMGDFERAAEEIKLWRPCVKDGLQDCAACEMDSEADYMARRKFDERCLQHAQPILAGRFTCSEVPHATLGLIIRPLIRLGRFDEAQKHAEKGYRLAAKNEEFIVPVAEFLLLATTTNEWSRAVRIFSKHAEWSLTTGLVSRRFYAYAVAAAFLEKLAREKGGVEPASPEDGTEKKRRSTGRLKLPQNHPCHRPDDRYDIGELATWYRSEAERLAEQFNQRNENRYFSDWLEETRQLAGLQPLTSE